MTQIILQIILFIYKNLAFENLGIAIIEVSVLLRLILHPFIKQQTGYSQKMNELQPKLKELKRKHKDDKQAFSQAQMQLFKEHNINPLVGCLPVVIQIVILYGLLQALSEILKMNLNTKFIIWDLTMPDVYEVKGLPFKIPGILVIIAALTQYLYSKMLMPTPPKVNKEDKPKEVKEKAGFQEEFAQAQSSMIWMFPLMFLFFGTLWPSGLALYWSVSSSLALVQQNKIKSVKVLKK